jgi:hypothetical protein
VHFSWIRLPASLKLRTSLRINRKNKKAAKLAAQAEAAAGTNGQMPSSPATPTQNIPTSPQPDGQSVAHSPQQQAAASGLSSMFGRTASSTAGLPQSTAPNAGLSSDHAEAAIGMSPMGLPIPADLSLPAGAAQIKGANNIPGADSLSTSKPKAFSYASIVGSGSTSKSQASSSSPKTSTSGFQQQQQQKQGADSPNGNSLRSPSFGASVIASTSPSAHISRSGINPASPSFVPRGLQSPGAGTNASSNGRLSTSVPSSYNMDQMHQQLPSTSKISMQATNPHQVAATHRLPHQPSPLVPPPLQQSHSYTGTLPQRAGFQAMSSPSLAPGAMPAQGQNGSYHRTTASPATAVFGTSPFGNNAIFLSTSHEEETGSYMGWRAHASGAVAMRGTSPAGPSFGSFEARNALARNRHGSSALADDDEDGTADIDILEEEELVPSSLKHLLTPDEKARRESRSGAKSGFFNPFHDVDGDEEEAYEEEFETGLRLRYSQSVPANGMAFNPAPGSPPVVPGAGIPGMSGSIQPMAALDSLGQMNGGYGSNLSRHLLASGPQQNHRIERGFAMSPLQPSYDSQATNTQMLGSSLPQGMAAGLSRLHMIPAGAEHTGYTPPTSFIQSPPAQIGNRPQYQSATSPLAGGSSNAFLAPGNLGRGSLGTSYGIKLPSLLQHQHPSIGRKTSSTYHDGSQVHVGSPLARHEIHGHVGGGRDNNGSFTRHRDAQGDGSQEGEEEDLVFDMDV